MKDMPAWFARTLTWDNGKEMARHARITDETGVQVYFAGPHAPWQRGSNQNTNGLLREYLPKGTDLSRATPEQLQLIQGQLNDRPPGTLQLSHTPEQLAKLLETKALRPPPETANLSGPRSLIRTPRRTPPVTAASPPGIVGQKQCPSRCNDPR
jgi:transposase, IS30 family